MCMFLFTNDITPIAKGGNFQIVYVVIEYYIRSQLPLVLQTALF